MKLQYLLASAAMLAAPTFASAQGLQWNSNVTLGYAMSSIDVAGLGADIDANTVSLAMESDVIFSETFTLGFDLGLSQSDIEISGTPINLEVELSRLSLEPTYHFANGFYAGAYYAMNEADLTIAPIPISFGLDLDQYGVFGGYDNGQWGAELYIGRSDVGIAGVDIADYGLEVNYHAASNFDIFAAYQRSDIGIGATDLDVSLLTLGGEYSFNNGVALFGSLGYLDVTSSSLPSDIEGTQLALGVSYDLAHSGAGFPGVVSLEVSRGDVDLAGLTDIESTRVGVGLTIPLGANASSSATPVNARGNILSTRNRSALVSGLGSLF